MAFLFVALMLGWRGKRDHEPNPLDKPQKLLPQNPQLSLSISFDLVDAQSCEPSAWDLRLVLHLLLSSINLQ